jgi:ribosomal protein S18 acetylase RimI-like enzyme
MNKNGAPLSNYERLVKLADEVFAVKSDPTQLDVNPEVLERLRLIHRAAISEYSDKNGPCAWVLLIPTTLELMLRFVEGKITEKQLYELTPLHQTYEAIYFCSALVLEEYRRKGIVKKLILTALDDIQKKHPLKAAFVWAFSPEGDRAAEAIARLAGLPLYKREK